MSTLVNDRVNDEMQALGLFNATSCMSCGVCSAICPLDIRVLPRHLMRYAALGMQQQLAENEEAIFSCLLCRACEANCPAGVHIAENIRLMRTMLLREGN